MRRLRSARLAVLACLSLRSSSGTILRPHSSFFQMRKMASSGIRYEYVDGQTRSGLHKRAGRSALTLTATLTLTITIALVRTRTRTLTLTSMLSDSTGQALAATWVEVARASAEADELPGVMRTDELPVESLPSPAASILALHEVTLARTRTQPRTLTLTLTLTLSLSLTLTLTRRRSRGRGRTAPRWDS